jgi:hypothetical protein
MPFMVTTVDNPYNYFTQFDQWYEYDTRMGYHTLSFFARIVRTSEDLSPADQEAAFDDAVNEIIEHNVLGLYRKVEDTTEQQLNNN